MQDDSHGSWSHDSEGYSRYLYDVVEYTYSARFPIADGAASALRQIHRFAGPGESFEIEGALSRYEARGRTTTSRRDETTEILESVTTYDSGPSFK